MPDPVIHLVLFASQPDIQRACDNHWDYPALYLNDGLPLPDDCFWASDWWAYTFDETLTNCPVCQAVAKERSNEL